MANDWIKVHRSLMDSAVWSDEWLVKLWLWCLLKANYGDAVFRGTLVKRGQFATGRNTAADELHVSPSKWYRGMMRLAELGNIEIHANSVWTMVTVCNYSTYQDATGDKRTAVGQRLDSERTADDTTNGQRADTREEGKKVRREEGVPRTLTPAREAGTSATLRTWQTPPGCSPELAAAIDRWQAWRLSVDGRPTDGIRLETMLTTARSAGWADAKIVKSIEFSISKDGKSWLDPELDFQKQRSSAGNGKPTPAKLGPVPPPREKDRSVKS